jgi:hypothetical protein
MAYHIGRILHRDFGFEVAAVTLGDEHAGNGLFLYEVPFPAMPIAEMEQVITDCDILIANPSFSSHLFGLRLPGRKLMYVQDFKTFALLDRGFDHYVCVSGVVAKFLAAIYGVRARIISAFIAAERFPSALPWRARPAESILIHVKGDPNYQNMVLTRLRDAVARELPRINLDIVLNAMAARSSGAHRGVSGGGLSRGSRRSERCWVERWQDQCPR